MDKDKLYDLFMEIPLENRKIFLYGLYSISCASMAEVFLKALKKE